MELVRNSTKSEFSVRISGKYSMFRKLLAGKYNGYLKKDIVAMPLVSGTRNIILPLLGSNNGKISWVPAHCGIREHKAADCASKYDQLYQGERRINYTW